MRNKKLTTKGQFCDNPGCKYHNKIEAGNVTIHSRKDRRFRCKECKKTWTETKGTMFYNLNTPKAKVIKVLHALSEGTGLRATARLHNVTTDAILDWVEKAANHVKEINAYLSSSMNLNQIQIDEFWSFVQKKIRKLKEVRMTKKR